MLYNFALKFIVMRQEEATKDRRWLQVGKNDLSYRSAPKILADLFSVACRMG